jgi:hypothetical protein
MGALGQLGQSPLWHDPLTSLAAIPDEAVEHGEVFTRRWVVDMILDLSGYLPSADLAAFVAVEPACGTGAFLGAIVARLSASCRAHGRPIADAADALRAFDLLLPHVEASRRLVEKVLLDDDWAPADALELARTWVRQADYLLDERATQPCDFVLGNPPYIRLEDVPADRGAAYRAACPSMTGRADIYVGFFDVALRSLRPEGVLGFICADRWMRNQYGRHLRQLISSGFRVEATISMHDVDAFEETVSAYPAVSIIRRAEPGPAVVADTTSRFDGASAPHLVAWAGNRDAEPMSDDRFEIARLPHWFDGDDSWPAGSPARLALIERLNDRFRPIQDPNTGTRVGIGVATGADAVFVVSTADVEPDRLLPLSMVRDTASGRLEWSGHHLVNPWTEDGQLIDLAHHPKLRRYLERHRSGLRDRHVAGKRPAHWYRTIDKVDHRLIDRPKLLFPDMKLTSRPVLDPGGHYPHHNLYYVISDVWDLRVLGGLLMSDVAQLFIEAYAVRMRGGTLRFQAQYLRRIRVPDPDMIVDDDRRALAVAFDNRDSAAATRIALRVYGIDAIDGDAASVNGRVRAGRT